MAKELENPESADHGSALIPADPIKDPGLPPHHTRVTDIHPSKERHASRVVATWFWISMIMSIFATVAYFVWPIKHGDLGTVRLSTTLLGVAVGLALLSIGLGAAYWAKHLMVDTELVDERHPTSSDEETREIAAEYMHLGNVESGFTRRKLIRNSLIGALALSPLPAVVMLRDLAPADDPNVLLKQTMWKQGERLARDPSGTPIKASDVTLGSAFHVIPQSLNKLHGAEMLNEKAKAIVLLMRLKPEDLKELPERKGWSYDGIVAYSKVCTHVGCPVALYEQQTHHLLCPCHQSTFDVTEHCKVIFGPAARPLPQLPIAIDSEGYLVAQSDFLEPVGPSFWERER
ncbi:MAG: Rieske 2Fe-2S domain-containing protein [Microbacteriaceae bacterium]|nr:Rieske 2Fe-2S domain-containing protein [Microbacteriaceae bacterium]